jgi:hypothetical protein
VIELRVVEAVQEVDRPRARGGEADADFAGELGMRARHERRQLFVPRLHELHGAIGSAERAHDAVDAVAGIAVDAPHAPFTEALEQEIANRGSSHARSLQDRFRRRKEGQMLRRIMQDLRGDSIVARDGVVGSLKMCTSTTNAGACATSSSIPAGGCRTQGAGLAGLHRHGPEAGGSAPLGTLRLRLSREEIEHSPPLDSALPVSRQFQEAHARYYRYNWYWTEPNLWGAYPGSAAERTDEEAFRQMKAAESKAERSHLRSTRAVAGYHIEAADGSLGHVEDFALDDEHWTIAACWSARASGCGENVLVAPAAVRAIDWRGRKMVLRMSCDDLRRARDAL